MKSLAPAPSMPKNSPTCMIITLLKRCEALRFLSNHFDQQIYPGAFLDYLTMKPYQPTTRRNIIYVRVVQNK